MCEALPMPSDDRSRLPSGRVAALLVGLLALGGCVAPRSDGGASLGASSGPPGGRPRHATVVRSTPVLTPDPAFGETAWIDAPLAFDQLLASWNVDVVDGSGVVFQVQVRACDGRVTPWLDLGEWGAVDPRRARVVEFPGGHVDVDTLVLDEPVGVAARLRMRSIGPDAARLALLALTFSDRRGRATPAPPAARTEMPEAAVARLGVPFRSQRAAAPSISHRVCSPTSVAMALAAADLDVALARVAALAYDPTHDLYGVWPRSIQTAYALGLPGFLTRFEGWAPVHALLEAGLPIVVSIKAAPGELTGAPYESTDGHLLVLSGVDAAGDLLVHDPAASDVFDGVTTYAREELDRCWLENGGTAYVFVPVGRDPLEIAAML